jgi:RNA polymerase sigma factor (sigma-70 family)
MLHTDLSSLVERARRGDQAAWDELVSRHAGLVWAITRAHRLSAADAADVAQATWLKLVEHLPRLRNPDALCGWLATTARRECLRVLKQADRVVPTPEAPDVAADRPGPDAKLIGDERAAVLWQALARLSGRDQMLLRVLAADPPPSYQQIGAALGMPIGSIGPTRARALARLRREVDRLQLRESLR